MSIMDTAKGFRSVQPYLYKRNAALENGKPFCLSPVLPTHLSDPSPLLLAVDTEASLSLPPFPSPASSIHPSNPPLLNLAWSSGTVGRADPKETEAYSSAMLRGLPLLKAMAAMFIRSRCRKQTVAEQQPRSQQPPACLRSSQSSPTARVPHRDRKEDTRRYRVEPRSIFDYEPGRSSVLEQEKLPPKKTLDEVLNADSPVPDQLSSRLSGEDGQIHANVLQVCLMDYRNWGKSMSSMSHDLQLHTANQSPGQSHSTNQGQMWHSEPAHSCASPLRTREQTLFRHEEAHFTQSGADSESNKTLSSDNSICLAEGWGEEDDGDEGGRDEQSVG
ncbi:Sorbin and SH3 domain-containing protein 2 [Merluccius polli]|uniref:Sorbin and SH3 domain-containing protein 2 n=1 Tax=Merluccius polli TaxID=89951 RepID=A0AA47MLG9_MERPO|nr:Sorbin and SH3 domain-containing protein 2 [Merluccius polli]